jgi:hypothetical protein
MGNSQSHKQAVSIAAVADDPAGGVLSSSRSVHASVVLRPQPPLPPAATDLLLRQPRFTDAESPVRLHVLSQQCRGRHLLERVQPHCTRPHHAVVAVRQDLRGRQLSEDPGKLRREAPFSRCRVTCAAAHPARTKWVGRQAACRRNRVGRHRFENTRQVLLVRYLAAASRHAQAGSWHSLRASLTAQQNLGSQEQLP